MNNEDSSNKQPQRRCISCRSNGHRTALLRFVVSEGELCFDLRKKAPGRGYYVCAQRCCIEKAMKGAFRRLSETPDLKMPASADQMIDDILLPALRKRYEECLLVGRQNQTLLMGADAVENASKHEVLSAYVLALDASDSTRQKYSLNAQRKGLPCLGLLDRTRLAQLLGKNELAVLGWLAGSAYDEFFEVEQSILRLTGQIPEENKGNQRKPAKNNHFNHEK